MNILLPFKVRDIGGTATFAVKFREELERNGHSVTDNFCNDFDTLFIIADCPIWLPIITKIRGKRIAQRLDGVYHRATPAGRLYPLYNFKMMIIHRFLADIVIYQSEFSQRSCQRFLGKTNAQKTAIIYNGVDVDRIELRKPETARKMTRLLTFMKFRRRDQIEPLLESVKLLDPEKFSFDIYGSYTDNLEPLFHKLPANVHFHGKVDNKDMLGKLCQYDIFLFSDQSACPNSVLEALAAGLPVVAFDRGSIPELIESGYNGKTVQTQEGTDPFFESYPFTKNQYTAFAEAIVSATDSLPSLSKNSRERIRERYSLSEMTRSYVGNLT